MEKHGALIDLRATAAGKNSHHDNVNQMHDVIRISLTMSSL